MDNEAENLLREAVAEIRQVRRSNELMSARLQMFDAIQVMLYTEPKYPSQGMSPDVAWQIEKYLTTKSEAHPETGVL